MSAKPRHLELAKLPGHHARRLHQLDVAFYQREVGDLKLTPVQYAALQTICNQPGIDQKTLATSIGFDTSTIAGVVERLETRGLVTRAVDPNDRRARRLTPTAQGEAMLDAVIPRMLKAQERLLAPLTRAERAEIVRLMRKVVEANETGAPGELTEGPGLAQDAVGTQQTRGGPPLRERGDS